MQNNTASIDPARSATWAPPRDPPPLPYLAILASVMVMVIAPFVWAHYQRRVTDIDRRGHDPTDRRHYALARTVAAAMTMVWVALVIVIVVASLAVAHA